MHITIRLAWHNNGWNGHVCSEPEKNTFCIGRSSYPGDLIKGTRDLEWEMRDDVKGKACGSLESGLPACGFSINAFGSERTKAKINAPVWFGESAKAAYMDIPESTVCIWNYEGMYSDDVVREPGKGQKYDYEQRLNNANEYFDELREEEGKSLLFYYANYSNPFSEDEEQKYVLIGISRLRKVGKIQYYEGTTDEVKKKYAGGFVWQMPISSNYPEEGFVIPYHKYMNNPEVLQKILLVPENKRNFKYATRSVPDDDALALVERMIEIASYLKEIGDDTQNWSNRINWLLTLFTELWKKRGAYPGLPEVLSFIKFEEGIEYYKSEAEKGNDKQAFQNISDLLNGKITSINGLDITPQKFKEVKRNWLVREDEDRDMLLTLFPRFALTYQQIENILSTERASNNISATLKKILENPYLLCEQYIGDDMDDIISFHLIDHGVLPNPSLGIKEIFAHNSAERLRALCIDVLKKETVHSFVSQTNVLSIINKRLSYLPAWKSFQFLPRYFEIDSDFMEEAITYRKAETGKVNDNYLYLKDVREDEKLIHSVLRNLNKDEIQLKVTIDEKHFYNLLKDPNSTLLEKAPKEYDEALKGQAKVCVKVFTKPICVISGAAGTGKTTILKSIIRSIEKAHGVGTGIILLAPTGKASVRMNEKTEKRSSTIHSFLATGGWLNENFTFKKIGKQNDTITTLIIDECSMIDLSLFATLLRSINWNSIQRLILVGDPNQLPPIGRGKVFNDIIEWMKAECPENLGKLDINVRQLENIVNKKGNGILELADIFIQEKQSEDNFKKNNQETILKKIQQGGIIDKDLSVHYWKEMGDLEIMLKSIVISDLEEEAGQKAEQGKFYKVWNKAITKESDYPDPSAIQFLSPYRGEFYGTDYLNTLFQELFNGYQSNKTQLDGIALYDKVIQFRNRPQSNKISAYSWKEKKNVKIDIYNGELGFVHAHPFDKNTGWSGFSLKKFQVNFERRDDYSVNYGYLEGYDNKPMFYEPVDENVELGYVISVHKAQGSEFNKVYLVLPKKMSSLLSMELIYTAITRAQKHLTIFVQEDISTFIELTKIEKSNIRKINSSIFNFNPIPDELYSLKSNWYEDQKVISTLSEYFVRSKSEMNIANILAMNNIPFRYEMPKFAGDGSMYLPDFTILWKGEEYYWEHVGRLDLPEYKKHWETKKEWYEKNYKGRLIITFEGTDQTKQIKDILKAKFNIVI
jgi:exodeoxyribonuclease V alpha subunit